ncbi:MAG TPA: hypothetical protein VHC22_16320 [Pirellulales bacterium]|nr:hypothetical protein [Pirellulales bacterium]
MSDETYEGGDTKPRRHDAIDFRAATFPSDALSIERLRTRFPKHFDVAGRIADGYAGNDFFVPVARDAPQHLHRLTEMICDERTVAAGAFYQSGAGQLAECINREDIECVNESKVRLLDNYLFFGLAADVEKAAALVRRVEREGQEQAHRRQSRSR